MMTLNIHDVQTIDLGSVRSYFCRNSNRLFYAREILITSSSGCFRMSLYADQSTELNLDSSDLLQIPSRINDNGPNEGAVICLKS